MKLSIIVFIFSTTFALTGCNNRENNSSAGKILAKPDTSSNNNNESLKKYSPVFKELYDEILHADSVLFKAFNTQQFNEFKSMFTEDLEWFQDNDGLVPYKTVFENFGNTFKKENKLTRELVLSSLEVYPIKNYGAVETGIHKFRHIENGKEEAGVFKFLMIWKKDNNKWKISRVVSYNH